MAELTGWSVAVPGKSVRVDIVYEFDEIMYKWKIGADHLNWEIVDRACDDAKRLVPVEPWKSAEYVYDFVENIRIKEIDDGVFIVVVNVVLSMEE